MLGPVELDKCGNLIRRGKGCLTLGLISDALYLRPIDPRTLTAEAPKNVQL